MFASLRHVRFVSASCTAAVVAALLVPVVQSGPAGAAPSKHSTQAASEPVTRPDAVSAALAARLSGDRVEVTSLRSATSTTWANPDGTFTTDTAESQIRVLRGGAWVDVNLDLHKTADGWSPIASPVSVTFADGGDKGAVSLGAESRHVDLSSTSALPVPTIDGATASYDMGGGQTYVLTATINGFEQSLVLASAPATAPTFKLPFDTTDLDMSTDDGGGFVFTNAGGSAVWAIPAPVMYGALIDPDTEEPTQQQVVAANLVQTANGARLDLSPSMAWLSDPATVYPVRIDPTITRVGGGSDTYVQDNAVTSVASEPTLHVGWWGTGHAARAYLNFTGVSAYAGKHITAASLNLYEYTANTCTPAPINVFPLTSAFTGSTVWTTRPSWTASASYKSSATIAHGVLNGCSNAAVTIDVKNMVTGWASGAIHNYGLQLSGTESTGNQAWGFCSFNYDPANVATSSCSTAAHQPYLSITYNTVPGGATAPQLSPCTVCTGAALTNTATPQLSALVADADGGVMRYDYEVWAGSSATPVTRVTYGSVTGTSATRAAWTVPTGQLANGSTYEYRARGYDGTDYGPWTTGWSTFTVDTTAPATPTISSTVWPAGQWSTPTTGALSWSTASTDVATYQYKLDADTWSTPASATTKTVTVATNAPHTLSVKATDKAGNTSATQTYTFGVGTGGVTSPADQANSQARVTLSAAGPTSETHVAYQWRNGTQGAWAAVPLADVTTPGTTTHPPAWPVPIGAKYTWDLTSTAAGADGLYGVRACLYTSATDPSPTCESAGVAVTLAAHAFGGSAATGQVGPGTVSKLTGDFDVSAADVSVASYNGSLSISRDFTTLAPVGERTDASGIFGPGWTTALTGPAGGAADLTLTDQASNGYLLFTGSDGAVRTYQSATAVDTYPIRFTGVGSSVDDSTVTKVDASTITTTDTSNATTTWTKSSSGWAVSSVAQAGSNSTTSYTYDSSGRVTRILAPVPTGVTCTSPNTTSGCRSLTFAYTTITVGPSTYTRLQTVTMHAFDPATSAMAAADIATYDYDPTGRLAHAWDPRISPALRTAYTYDSNGRLATIVGAGMAGWTLSYDSTGRLITATRPDPANGIATTRVVYGVPFTGSSAPVELGATAAATWGQTHDLPTTATAIFAASHPADATPSASDWPYADLTYIDADGREVNSASYGANQWLVETTTYDTTGDAIWSLTADNRAQALSPAGDTDPAVAALTDSDDRADLLATVYTYNIAGTVLLSAVGPTHPVQLTDGTTVDARSHTTVSYDQGAPATGGPYDLPTTQSSSAQTLSGTDVEPQVTRTGYDPITVGDTSGWDLRQATTHTTQMASAASSADLVAVTRYDPQGRVIETRLPGGMNGGDARSTLSTYYTATGTGGCVSAHQAGSLCKTAPAAQPTSGAPLPTTIWTYDMAGHSITMTASYTSNISRTSTTTYDAAERPLTDSTVVSPPSEGGTVVPTVTTGYDSATGLPTTRSTPAATITTAYDALGQITSYTDAAGATSTTSYDLNGRQVSSNNGKLTTTYTYDSASEHRGLITSEDIGVAGAPSTFTAQYNARGDLSTQTYPNGLTSAIKYDNSGNPSALSYAESGLTWMTFTSAYDSQDRVAIQTSPESMQSYTYDADHRLTTVQDTYNSACITRDYSFDRDSNRTMLKTYPGGSDSSCSTSTTPATSVSDYDQADRLTNTGYTYDALGRTITIPSVDAQSSGSHAATTGDLTIGYYANDMVSSQSQGTSTQTYALDAEQDRIAAFTIDGTTTTKHYSGASDSPSWTTRAGNWTDNIAGPAGGLAATTDQTGTVSIQLCNLHGDVVAITPDDLTAEGIASYSESTEYGQSRNVASAPTTYGWLGSEQRSSDTLGSVTLMGVRLYIATTGRFLSVDPIAGGNDNAYVYVGDPINEFDLNGQCNPFRHFARCLRAAAASSVGQALIKFVGTFGKVLCWATPEVKPFCGAIAGALVAGTTDALAQWVDKGHVDWGEVILAAVVGALNGSGLSAKAITKVRDAFQKYVVGNILAWIGRIL